MRVGEDAPVYPHRNGNTKWVPIGPLPAGGDPTSFQVSYHEKPASEGGCSAGRLEGCNIFNIKVNLRCSDGLLLLMFLLWVLFMLIVLHTLMIVMSFWIFNAFSGFVCPA